MTHFNIFLLKFVHVSQTLILALEGWEQTFFSNQWQMKKDKSKMAVWHSGSINSSHE